MTIFHSSMPRRYGYTLVLTVSLLSSACGGGGSDPTPPNSTAGSDATLSALSLSNGELDQVFQSSQASYTASAGYLLDSIGITAVANDTNATISINGSSAGSGIESSAIPLVTGSNNLSIEVTSADTTVTQDYSVDITKGDLSSLQQRAFIKADNAGNGDLFGRPVAVSGNTLVIGAPDEDSAVNANGSDNSETNSGAAYVFVRNGNSWTQQAMLKADNARAEYRFGASVSISGDTLVVGSPSEGKNISLESGAAYVFTRSNGNWTQQAMLKAANADGNDDFGVHVAIDSNLIAVAATGEGSAAGKAADDNSAPLSGAVYLFEQNNGSWTQQSMLKASNAESYDQFGSGLSISGETVVVGAASEDSASSLNQDDNSAAQSGAAYVFVRNNGAWTQQAYLKASAADQGDNFGFSVAVSNNLIVVGAIYQDDNSPTESGAAYVFARSGSDWSQQGLLKPAGLLDNVQFGFSVAIRDHYIAVGTKGVQSNSGAVYLYHENQGVYTQLKALTASNAEPGDVLGESVAIADDYLAISAIGESSSFAGGEADNSETNAGAVYIWR